MSRVSNAEKIQEIADRLAAEDKFELVHVEVLGADKSPTVRVYLDKEGGITHEDCALFSRQIGDALDAEDFISSAYLLEVSSPGLERQLYSLKDFEKFAGSLAKVRTHVAIGGQRNFRGRIKSVTGENIVFDDKTSGEFTFPYSAVAKANLEIDLEKELNRNAKLKTES